MDATQTRQEFKFLLPAGIHARLTSEISEYLPYDRGMQCGYSIVSEYYDSSDFKTYWQKQMSHPNRRRLRTRFYNPNQSDQTPSSFLEVKHRLLETTVKRRLAVSLDQITHSPDGRLLPPPSPHPDQRAACRVHSEITDLLKEGLDRPTVRSSFHRFAFDEGPSASIRITFDDQLCTQLWRNGQWTLKQDLFPNGATIMEVKSIAAVPYWFRKLIAKHSLVPRGVSKYGTALDSAFRPTAEISPPPQIKSILQVNGVQKNVRSSCR